MTQLSDKEGRRMGFLDSRYATEENRWYALVIIALALAVVIIDNTVLNVSIPYMLRDLGADLPSIEWVISGYALTIATVLITIGRAGDIIGRKRMFLMGMALFALGSFIGSEATVVDTVIAGRAIIQAIGAAMSLTSALALIAGSFHGRERALAFGVWGAIAGASASIGPLLGGFLTTYYSWRWSLRINIAVAAIAILGSVFIRESRGEGGKGFDFLGTMLSGAGFFTLVFGFIEGSYYGWLFPNQAFSVLGASWPFGISVIPFFFAASVVFLGLFAARERRLERTGGNPLLKPSIFRNRGFSIGAIALALLAFGQFGIFFLLPIYLENALGLDAFLAGVVFLSSSVSIFIFGTLSGVIASRMNPRWLVISGMSLMTLGSFLLIQSLGLDATGLTLAPALIIYGAGLGLGSAQLTNVILSSAPVSIAGEASAVTTTMRQLGASIGIAVIGAMLAASLVTNITANVEADSSIPPAVAGMVISSLGNIDVEAGQIDGAVQGAGPDIAAAVGKDIGGALVDSTKYALGTGFFFILAGALVSFLIPALPPEEGSERHDKAEEGVRRTGKR
jgi:EmrB/QacA subfamily drug resistance transporter